MDTERSVELVTATLVVLLVTRYGHEAAARYLEGLAAHGWEAHAAQSQASLSQFDLDLVNFQSK